METEIEKKRSVCENVISFEFVKVVLKGAGQVMFQNSAITGLLFFAGIFWGAYEEGQGVVAWGALVGVVVSTLTGYLLGLPCKDGSEGLWGFNGILVGCAMLTFLGNTVFTWLALIFCSAMTTWMRTGFNNALGKFKVNSFTFPFVFTTWLFVLASRAMQAMPPEFMSTPELPAIQFSSDINMGFGDLVVYWLKGISQVFLINSWVTGALFLIGLFLCNKWAAIWAGASSAIALFIILVFKGPGTDISNGLYGFSAVLTGIALGMVFYKVNWRSAIWAVIGVVATVFIQAAMNIFFTPLGLPTFTAPFCLATWLFFLPLFKFDVKSEELEDHSTWHGKKN
ncbi:MAG: urea transporter [Prevotellaceae bacterium]|nr:urea transporter [Prevotellaceae bacterium]